MRRSHQIALGGLLGALAVVIMCLGGLVPFATYVCPVLCILTLQVVDRVCGRRIAWAWYGAVSFLSLLLGPDKEAAAVFVFLGCYPMVKARLDAYRGKWIWKLLFFNAACAVMYGFLIWLMGMRFLMTEFLEAGAWGLVLTLVMGNVTFFLLDGLLCRITHINRARK